jgi:hypothetical protein
MKKALLEPGLTHKTYTNGALFSCQLFFSIVQAVHLCPHISIEQYSILVKWMPS